MKLRDQGRAWGGWSEGEEGEVGTRERLPAVCVDAVHAENEAAETTPNFINLLKLDIFQGEVVRIASRRSQFLLHR
eukprot:755703-Hanusia_phi.AAC.1